MLEETLNVKKREETGSLRMKRLRQSGQIPAILYGHGQDNMMLAVCERELSKIIEHRSHVVQLKGAANESALIKTVQWDAFGIKVVHLDLTRVDASEAVEVTLPIELKGDAPGTHAGGTINFHQHQLSIMCPANMIPDKIELRVNELELNQSIVASEIPLPEGAVLAEAGTTPIVSCAEATEGKASSDDEDTPSEPEVIGKKDDTSEE